jgi:prepilin-type N-terminal cleavage/methylation domain-containing protein
MGFPSQVFQIRYKTGFTMVELLIVIFMIGILTVTGLTSYTASQRNSRDAKRKIDLENIRQALEMYHSDNSTTSNPYPNGNGRTGDGGIGTSLNALITPIAYVNSSNFPRDPSYKQGYEYFYQRLTSNTYVICARVENTTGIPTPPTACASLQCHTTDTTKKCNYGLTQP